MNIRLPDGTEKQFDNHATAYDVAASIGEGLAKAAIGARVNDELVDVNRPIKDVVGDAVANGDEPIDLGIITAPRFDKKGRSKWRDEQHERDALYLLRHSTAHVMAEAIQRIFPGAQLAYGPPLDNGFYYDIKLDTPISSDDFEKIEAEMKKIVEEQRPFSRYELEPDQGLDRLKTEGNKYKVDNAERAMANHADSLSWYVTGPIDSKFEIQNSKFFQDLCQGPHVDNTSRILPGAFKITNVAQSHWHGDITSDAFQRVYGTAFFSEADLEDHLEKLEQARQRDHRVVGQKLGLFTIDETVGQGLILWKPNGAVVRQELQNFIGEHLERQGYSQVFTPHIGKLELFKTSGHFPYYADSQFPPIFERETIHKLADGCATCAELAQTLTFTDMDKVESKIGDISGGGYMLKPMNCPFHVKIFASEKRSYRDLPVRLAEFGTVYRWEQSGELGGMTRVRGFTQDDAHLFVMPDQLAEEVLGCIELVKIVFETLGMEDYRVRVGLRDPDSTKFVGESSDWDQAESACIEAAQSLGVPFKQEPGEAAFYGPKIDFVVKDIIGRDWQLGTVQVDYQLPQRFNLEYVGADNKIHRPIMIHRAPFGSMERFVGCLIEHFNGAFPLWLAPEQMRVLPISDKFNDYAAKVLEALKAEGFRASVDKSNERVNAKIKAAQDMQVPYMLIVGGKDEQAGTVSVRERREGDLGAVSLEVFIREAVTKRDERQG